jgi:glycosyltransferase involved in cell wall biosynthesis
MTPVAAAATPLELTANVRNLTGPRTGIEIYMEALLGALAATGSVQITALTWSPLGLALPGVREVIPVRRPDLPPGSMRGVLWKLWFDQWACLRDAPRDRPILYHGMDGFLPFALRRRDRCLVTVHDLGWQVHPELFSPRLRLMYGSLFPWVVRRADRFIAVSRYTADDLMRRAGVPATRIDVVHHGLDPAFLSGADPSARDGQPYLLAVGGVSPRKNTRRLIEAFVRWRGRGGRGAFHRLVITGISLDQEFVRSGLPDGVTLTGYVDKGELRRLYASAAAFVYPGIYEGFGFPILEAMACGTPVVTSSTGAAPEIAGGAALLVDPFDPDSIEGGIERATEPEEAERLRALGRERIRAFRWEDAARATIEAYRRAAA